ncbi:MAG: hypothetical protein CMJ90_15730 [Planctomycetes bacterium]|nr:hypothetical protein [Planctomycetota bacterium]
MGDGGGKWLIIFTQADAQVRPVTPHFFMWFSNAWTVDAMVSESRSMVDLSWIAWIHFCE